MVLVSQAPSVWRAAAWLNPHLWSLPSAETHSRHCPGWSGLFPTFVFLGASGGSITLSRSARHHQPPRSLSTLTPACSQLSQRSLSCPKGESTGPPSQLLTGALFSSES